MPLWSETVWVHADTAGKYSILLGASSGGVPTKLFTAMSSMWIGNIPESPSSPRVRFASAPYALKASDAETLAGHSVSDFVLRDQAVPIDEALQIPNPICWQFPCNPWMQRSTADHFLSTTLVGPSFISSALTGPPLAVSSDELVPKLNADLLHGLSPVSFAQTATPNEFKSVQSFAEGAILIPTGTSSTSNTAGAPSSPLDFKASVFNSEQQKPQEPFFRLQADPVDSKHTLTKCPIVGQLL